MRVRKRVYGAPLKFKPIIKGQFNRSSGAHSFEIFLCFWKCRLNFVCIRYSFNPIWCWDAIKILKTGNNKQKLCHQLQDRTLNTNKKTHKRAGRHSLGERTGWQSATCRYQNIHTFLKFAYFCTI